MISRMKMYGLRKRVPPKATEKLGPKPKKKKATPKSKGKETTKEAVYQEGLYIIDRFLDMRGDCKGEIEFKVKWKKDSRSKEDITWESARRLRDDLGWDLQAEKDWQELIASLPKSLDEY